MPKPHVMSSFQELVRLMNEVSDHLGPVQIVPVAELDRQMKHESYGAASPPYLANIADEESEEDTKVVETSAEAIGIDVNEEDDTDVNYRARPLQRGQVKPRFDDDESGASNRRSKGNKRLNKTDTNHPRRGRDRWADDDRTDWIA